MSSISGPISNDELRVKNMIVRRDRLDKDNMNMSLFLEIVTRLPIQYSWPFKIGLPVLIGSVGMTAMYIHNHFRKSLHLMHYLRASSYLAMIVVPSVAGSIAFTQLISSDILEQKTKCGICLQTKAAMLQGGIGVIYPLLLAPLVNFPTAGMMEGARFPKVTKNPREVLSFAQDIMKPIWGKIRIISLCHIVLAMGITHFQYDMFHSQLLPYIMEGKTTNTTNREVTK